MRYMTVGAVLMLLGGVPANPLAPAEVFSQPSASVAGGYDTDEQTKRKEFDLAAWAIDAQVAGRVTDRRYVVHETPGYLVRVIAIVQSRRPRPISFEVYESLSISDGDGESFADTVLKLGMRVQEVGRTSTGASDSVMYRWSSDDGAQVFAAFQNYRLVGKAQNGLR